jgi:hypothetical protein
MTDGIGSNAEFGEHNVVACFTDMEDARRAIAALEHSGVDASHISLLGQQVAEAIDQNDTAHRDERIMDEQAGSAAGGIAAGGLIGGTAGFLAGLAAFGIPGAGPVIAGGIWALSLGGAAAGAGVGLAATGYARIKQSEAWELTYDAVSRGSVAVGVHSPDKQDVDAAATVLEREGGSEIRMYDREGNQVNV